MSARRAALIERFRSRARERMREIIVVLRDRPATTSEEWNEHLGAIHTIKGESRMLGLLALAETVHGVEDALLACRENDDRPRTSRVLAALNIVETMLAAELVDDDRAREQRARALALLQSDSDAVHCEATVARADDAVRTALESVATQTVTRDDGAPPTDRAFVQSSQLEVSLVQVDALCEGIESLRASVAHARTRGGADGTTLGDLLARIERLADEAWELRIGSAEPMLTALARHAEDLARRQGKQLRATVDAEGTALDRPVLDALAEPLLHLIRNSVDHGLESPEERNGKPPTCMLTLQAVARGTDVSIVVLDDGRGIDVAHVRDVAIDRGVVDRTAASMLTDEEVLDLVFRPGFSTRTRVSELSGRGIGLDVVRRVAESLGGGVSVTSTLGVGTRFVVTVPVGLSRERVVVVPVHGALFGISGRLVRAVEELGERMEVGPTGASLRTNQGLVPVRSLAELVGFPKTEDETKALIVDIAERRWAIAVSAIAGERDLLRRPADAALASFGVASASAVLDDGRPVLLPTLAELLRRRGARGAVITTGPIVAPKATARRALVVDDSPIIRDLVAELLTSASFSVTSAVDGAAALEVLDRQSFDVVVSDLEMPNVDGLELLRRIRARGWPIPVVMVTTRGSAEDRKRAADLGASGYVVKTDFHEGHLVEVVRRAVGASP